jgi:hypothetical protein
VSASRRPIVWRGLELVDVKKLGETRLKQCELLRLLAAGEPHLAVRTLVPVIQTAHDMGRSPAIRVDTPRAERSDELPDANLSMPHSSGSVIG